MDPAQHSQVQASHSQRHYKSISRIDQPARCTCGWLVRVRFAGQTINKFFSGKLHSGKRAALT
jgi:hypothetical protein